jgi:hypothetical protein
MELSPYAGARGKRSLPVGDETLDGKALLRYATRTLAELARELRIVQQSLHVSNELGGFGVVVARLVVANHRCYPERWAPLDCARHRVLYRAVDCRPCMHWICPVGHPCAQGVEVRAVVEEAMRLLPQRAEAVPAAELRQ